MKQSDYSAQFPVVWASGAGSETVQYPVPTTTEEAGRASLTLGFPPATMTPLGAGGAYPRGPDVNGGFRMASTSGQNYEAGVTPPWSSEFGQSIGGYPRNACVADPTTLGAYWISTADDNLTTPGASGASWQSLFANISPSQYWRYQVFIPSSGSVASNTTTVTVGGSGCLMLCVASANIGASGVQPVGCMLSVNLDSTQIVQDTTILSMSVSRSIVIPPGTHSVSANYTAGKSSSTSWSSVGLSSSMIFMPLP